MHNQTRVRLPEWIWETAQDKNHLKQLIATYMKRYPDYTILKVKDKFAICQINR